MPRGKSAREFALDLTKFGKRTEQEFNQIFRKIAIDIDQALVLRTPVDTGRARGNWYPSINVPSSEVNVNFFDPDGTKATARAVARVAPAKIGDVIFLTNNVSYIYDLEQGKSPQAVSGILDVTLAAFKGKYGTVI